VPKTPFYFQPSFQGLIAILIACWLYFSARSRDATIASRAEQLTAE